MIRNLDIDLLRAFVAVTETRSFTRAADRLGRVQSAVSMQIKRLEETLDARLFDRDSRTVALTRDGERMLGYARRMLALNEEAVEVMGGPAIAGPLRIGASDVASYLLPAVLARLANGCPRLEIEIVCDRSWHLLDALEAGTLDFALVTQSSGQSGGRLIRQEPLVWATARDHNAAQCAPVPLALFGPGCIYREAAMKAMDDAGRPYRLAYSSANPSGLSAAVGAGLAVTTAVQSTLSPRLRVLGAADGFPALPNVQIMLFARAGDSGLPFDRLADEIADGAAEPVIN
jgi:DNA-binding transcriptional LysR family regulator